LLVAHRQYRFFADNLRAGPRIGQGGKQWCKRLVGLESHGVRVECDHLRHRRHPLADRRAEFLIRDPLEREHHIVCGHLAAVVEPDALSQPEFPRGGIWVGPGFGEVANNLHAGIEFHQSVEHSPDDEELGIDRGFAWVERVHHAESCQRGA